MKKRIKMKEINNLFTYYQILGIKYFPFINHMLQKKDSNESWLKCNLIQQCFFKINQINVFFGRKIYWMMYIIEIILIINF
jgi:hypothetical protein